MNPTQSSDAKRSDLIGPTTTGPQTQVSFRSQKQSVPSYSPATTPNFAYGKTNNSYISAYAGGYYADGTSATPDTHAPLSPAQAPSTAWTNTAMNTAKVPQRQSTSIPFNGLYSHNTSTICLWIPCWFAVFFNESDSSAPLMVFAFFGLVLYGLDLANFREAWLYAVWFSVLALSCVNILFGLVLGSNANSLSAVIACFVKSAVTAMFYTATACWATVQCEWIGKDELATMPKQLEATLHGILPITLAAFGTVAATQHVAETSGSDTAATVAPYLFTVIFAGSMLLSGRSVSSFEKQIRDQSQRGDNASESKDGKKGLQYAIPIHIAFIHKLLLAVVPAIMHLASFWGRIVSTYTSMDDMYDVFLTCTIPYLLMCMIEQIKPLQNSPYANSQVSQANDYPPVLPFSFAILASFAMQHRYLIPICLRVSYHFLGVQTPKWVLSLYWTITSISFLLAFWIWGRKSRTTGQLLFGDYHEDTVQLVLAVSGLSLGRAFGLPWNMTPLPILGILGLSLWATTRMLRYLTIVLFVVHATGVVVFTYRFVGIDQVLQLPLPNIDLSLVRFGMVVTVTSILVGLTSGLAVRSSGGYMAPLLKRFEVTGLILIFYAMMLMILEITLLKRSVPSKELIGVDEKEEIDESLYSPGQAFLTSAILIGVSLFMKRVRILQSRSSSLTISLAVGKAIAIFVDSNEALIGGPNSDPRGTGLLCQGVVGGMLFAVVFFPRVFLPVQPIYVKTSARQRRSLASLNSSPTGSRTIIVYAFLFIPSILIVAIPYALMPLINALTSSYRTISYFGETKPISEVVGSTVCLWGISCLSMLNYYLPDGGGEVWKKLSALAFLMGFGIVLTAPTFGLGLRASSYSPYTTVSSVGSQLIKRGKSRTGGWGILLAIFATLLAVVGPLELKEKRHISGRKDRYVLFRTMVFSVMFGGGVAWFITVQSMSESDWLSLILTLTASMLLAFLGTVGAVLGHHVEHQNFDEVEQIAKAWFFTFIVCIPIAGVPSIVRSGSIHPFGTGGWLSTYLSIGGLCAFLFSCSLGFRKSKDSRSRYLANGALIVSWVSAITVVYGKYGLVDDHSNYKIFAVLGVSSSVIGTFAAAPILLLLEGDRASRGRISSVTTPSRGTNGPSFFGLPQLNKGNRWFPLYVGTITVFLLASLYAVTLRGSGFLPFPNVGLKNSKETILSKLDLDSGTVPGSEILASLVKSTIQRNQAFAPSNNLDGCSFWTAKNVFRPTLHLLGLVAIIPSSYLLCAHFWFEAVVPAGQVLTVIPFCFMSIFLGGGIPCLRVAAIVSAVANAMQVILRRQTEQSSRMRI